MKIKELFEADVLNFGQKVHDLKNAPVSSTDPRTYRQKLATKKRATAKADDLNNLHHNKMMQLANSIKDEYLEEMWFAYMDAALWSSTDDTDDVPMDTKYTRESLSTETMESMLNTCKNFMSKTEGMIEELDPSQVGHDLWLTQNHHGAGFWDRDYPENLGKDFGDRLTTIAHSFPEHNLYVGDDGLIYY